MEIAVIVFLSSGLFLGWSLGRQRRRQRIRHGRRHPHGEILHGGVYLQRIRHPRGSDQRRRRGAHSGQARGGERHRGLVHGGILRGIDRVRHDQGGSSRLHESGGRGRDHRLEPVQRLSHGHRRAAQDRRNMDRLPAAGRHHRRRPVQGDDRRRSAGRSCTSIGSTPIPGWA